MNNKNVKKIKNSFKVSLTGFPLSFFNFEKINKVSSVFNFRRKNNSNKVK